MGWGTPIGVVWTSGSGPVSAHRHLRRLRSQEWITKSRYLKQEFQRHQRPPEHQSLRSLRPSEFAESSGSLPSTARSSTCCEMPQCYCFRGRRYFDPRSPRSDWSPTPDHYPRLRAHGGHLTPDNVRLAHLLCNRRDYGWRMKINAMLGKRMSLEEIAAHLNAQKVPPIHGTNRWTASSVRKAFVS